MNFDATSEAGNTPKPEELEGQGAVTTPAAAILESCNGIFHTKVKFWMDSHPTQLEDFGLDTFQAMQNNTDIDVADTAADLFEEINARIKEKGKRGDANPNCLSKHQARQLAGIIRSTARRCGGYTSPVKGDAHAQGDLLSSDPSTASGKTESQMSRETTQMAVYASVKHDVKLIMSCGDTQPAHLYDIMAYVEGVSKVLMGFEGYTALQELIMERKKDPGFDMMEKLSSYNLPPDLDKQFAKQLCSGTTAKYRTHILDKSGHGDGIYVSGIAFFAALMGTAADLDDLYCSEKRTAYLKTAPVRHNDKRALTAGICKYLRDSFELYHLQELGSTRTDPELTQYRIGATLLANYHDLSRKWSRLWDESGKQDMSRLRDMIIEIESDMRHMPTGGRHHAAPPVAHTGHNNPPTTIPGSKEICRNFRHKGQCRFGATCKFEHEADKPMVMLSQLAETQIGELQQWFMENMPASEKTLEHMSPELFDIYEEGLSTVGKPEHKEAMEDMQHVFLAMQSLSASKFSMNVQPEHDPVGHWSLDYEP